MEDPEMHRRVMLSDQMSPTAASSNLRDLLTVCEEEDRRPLRRQIASVSLGTILACEKREPSLSSNGLPAVTPLPIATTAGCSRTLLDIIRDEEFSGGRRSSYDGVISGDSNGGHKMSWKAFKDRLRVRRGATGGAIAYPLNDAPAAGLVLPPSAAVLPSSETFDQEAGAFLRNYPSSAVLVTGEAAERIATDTTSDMLIGAPLERGQEEASNSAAAAAAAAVTAASPPPQQIRVSLMTLLEQTDGQGEGSGFAVSALWEAEGDEGKGEEETVEEDGAPDGDNGEKMYVKCCVCMVRHKGAAFIPCGHTFCRRCSRELWVSRGNCPLCNGFILEILDIF